MSYNLKSIDVTAARVIFWVPLPGLETATWDVTDYANIIVFYDNLIFKILRQIKYMFPFIL